MFTHILVPLDGSALAERALPPAIALARQERAELRLVRVPVTPEMSVQDQAGNGLIYLEQTPGQGREEAQWYLETILAASAGPELRVGSIVAEGDLAGALVDTAAAENADLVVMSSHGYSGLTRWLLGSVAEKVLHAMPCPVLVVRSSRPIKHVLVTLDGSERAEQILAPALKLARVFGAQVTLLRVVPAITVLEIAELDTLEHGLGQRLVEEMIEAAQGYLAGLAERLGMEGVQVHTAVRSGSAAEVILSSANQADVDLLAMATHGRTGLRRWIYGSVTEKVLHTSPYSMLIARSVEGNLSRGRLLHQEAVEATEGRLSIDRPPSSVSSEHAAEVVLGGVGGSLGSICDP